MSRVTSHEGFDLDAREELRLALELRLTATAVDGAMQRRLDRHGIRYAHWVYLRVLYHRDGISQRALSAQVNRVGPNTVLVLNALSEMGLVRREQDAADGRAARVFLTATGRALTRKLMPLARKVQDQALRGLPKQTLEQVKAALHRIRANLSEK